MLLLYCTILKTCSVKYLVDTDTELISDAAVVPVADVIRVRTGNGVWVLLIINYRFLNLQAGV